MYVYIMYVRKSSIVSVEISRKRTGDFGTSFCPSQTQCTATVPAVHCNRPRSALQPPLQCTASVLALHCIRPCSASFPACFSLTEPKTCLAFVFLLSFCSAPYKISAESALSVWVPISQVLLPIGRR